MTFIDKIIAFENGELEGIEILDLFSDLIKTGQAWALQGSYGRYAQSLIEQGLIDRNGEVDFENYYNLIAEV